MKVTKMLEFTSGDLSKLMAEALRAEAVKLLGPLPEGMDYKVDTPSFYGTSTVEIIEKKTEVPE